jgi:hypothetical protein
MKYLLVLVSALLGVSALHAQVQPPPSCDFRVSALDTTDPGVGLSGRYTVRVLEIEGRSFSSPTNCVKTSQAVGKPNPRAFVEQRFDALQGMSYSITLSAAVFAQGQIGFSDDLPMFEFVKLDFVGAVPLSLRWYLEPTSNPNFVRVAVFRQTASSWDRVFTHEIEVSQLSTSPINLNWSKTEYGTTSLTLDQGNYYVSIPTSVVSPASVRFGALSESRAAVGTFVQFTDASSCTFAGETVDCFR